MALIKCPECGNDVSDSAAVCMRCGFPIRGALIGDTFTDSRDGKKYRTVKIGNLIETSWARATAARASGFRCCVSKIDASRDRLKMRWKPAHPKN